MRLPLEVRERIYFWLAKSHHLTQSGEMRFFLERHDPNISASKYLEHCQKVSPESTLAHPQRSRNYLLALARLETAVKPGDLRIRREKENGITTIRNLSNVSTQVRQELGVFLTRKVILHCQDIQYWPSLVTLLGDRPVFHRGIRSLRFNINVDEPRMHRSLGQQDTDNVNHGKNQHDQKQLKFISFCESAIQHLKLDSLEIENIHQDGECSEAHKP